MLNFRDASNFIDAKTLSIVLAKLSITFSLILISLFCNNIFAQQEVAYDSTITVKYCGNGNPQSVTDVALADLMACEKLTVSDAKWKVKSYVFGTVFHQTVYQMKNNGANITEKMKKLIYIEGQKIYLEKIELTNEAGDLMHPPKMVLRVK